MTMPQERRKGGRRSTDKEATGDHRVTSTNERSKGAIEHDDRGDARWVFSTDQQAHDSAAETFNELKALDNEALTLVDQPDPAQPRPPPGGGYNPYDVTVPPKKPATKKSR
jgi:hypothetical protein